MTKNTRSHPKTPLEEILRLAEALFVLVVVDGWLVTMFTVVSGAEVVAIVGGVLVVEEDVVVLVGMDEPLAISPADEPV
ncbi:hypothetical protein ANO14919_051770 [Xylariales sp. No.14919]|nr:hypothetical protein ANO14919_051770 [Xylariales sp. No.14919]